MQENTISPSDNDETRPVRKLFIRTFGCQMNEYDSEKMADVLNDSGPIEVTTTPDDADIILFNTCSGARKSTRKGVLRFRPPSAI